MEEMYKFNQIPSDAQIRKYLRKIVYGKNIYCPVCKGRNVYVSQERYRCRKCRIRFSLLSHTWLSNLKLPLQQFWMILWCWTTQIPVKQSMGLTGLSELTIRHWYDQFVPNPNPKREHAWWFLQTYTKPNIKLHTDGASIYKEIDRWWPVYHTREIHKRWEFELTSEIEGMIGVLRTFIRRMYHHVTMDKLPELVCEFCYRFSHPEMFKNPRFYLENTLFIVPTR